MRDELCKMDREYVSFSMRSKYPDSFQLDHRKVEFIDPELIDIEELPQKLKIREDIVGDTENFLITEDEPVESLAQADEKTVQIKENETGYSYQNLFGPYLVGAKTIYLTDPYIRLEYQIRNLLAFIGIVDTSDGPVVLKLTTSAEDTYQRDVNSRKFDDIANSLEGHDITFTYEFSDTLHKRGIELDNGWHIIIDRGLDIFQKPDSKYELSEVNQTKKKCRETEVVFIRAN